MEPTKGTLTKYEPIAIINTLVTAVIPLHPKYSTTVSNRNKHEH